MTKVRKVYTKEQAAQERNFCSLRLLSQGGIGFISGPCKMLCELLSVYALGRVHLLQRKLWP